MADVLLKPAFFSPYLDGPDATKLQPSAWNAARLFSAGNDGEIVVRSAASATGAAWTSPTTLKTTLGLNLVENTALSTWAGSAALTTIGQLATLKVGGAIAPGGVEGYFATSSAADPRGLMSAQYSTDATAARIHLRKARGTEAAPTTIVTGDVLGRVRFSGYDSANYLQMASIDVLSTGTIAATRVPTYMAFSVATDAAPSVLTEVLRLTPTLMTSSVPGTWAGLQTFNGGLALAGIVATSVNGIEVLSTDGGVLANDTLATAGVPVQQSPRLRVRAHVWNTTATAADNTLDWWLESVPISGATPSGLLKFGVSLNGAAATYPLTISSAGIVATLSTFTPGFNVSLPNGSSYTWSSRSAIASPANGQLNLTVQNLGTGIGLDMATDGILKVRTRAQTGNAALWSGADAIAVTSTDGLVVANDTLSTAGVPVQQSPRLRFRSHVWNTTATAVDNTDDWVLESVPVSGTTPSGLLKFGSSINGAAVTYPVTVSSAGNVGGVSFNASSQVNSPTFRSNANGTQINLVADGQVTLRNNANSAGVGLDFGTDSVLKVRPRSQSGYATVDALGYSVSGVAGASKGAGPVTSITVVNGIVTAIS